MFGWFKRRRAARLAAAEAARQGLRDRLSIPMPVPGQKALLPPGSSSSTQCSVHDTRHPLNPLNPANERRVGRRAADAVRASSSSSSSSSTSSLHDPLHPLHPLNPLNQPAIYYAEAPRRDPEPVASCAPSVSDDSWSRSSSSSSCSGFDSSSYSSSDSSSSSSSSDSSY